MTEKEKIELVIESFEKGKEILSKEIFPLLMAMQRTSGMEPYFTEIIQKIKPYISLGLEKRPEDNNNTHRP